MRTNSNGNRFRLAILFFSFLIFSLGLAVENEKTKVLLISPETTKQYLQSQSITYDTEEWVGVWRDLLAKSGVSFDIAAEPALHSLEQYRFVILSGAICLENSEIASLERFLSLGGGVLLVAEIGARHADGRSRGYQFLEDLLGAAPQSTGIMPSDTITLQLRGGQPATNALPDSFYLQLIPKHEPRFLPVTPLVTPVGYWASNGQAQKAPDQTECFPGFVVRQLETGGRIAWLGENVEGILGDEYNQPISAVLFNELFDWLSGMPLVAVEVPQNQAAILQGNLEDRFDLEVRDWFRKREALKMSTKYVDHIIRISLKNHSDTTMTDLVIRVVPPGGVSVNEIAPRKVSKSCTYDVTDNSFVVQLPKLKARETFEAELIEGGAGALSSQKKQVLMVVIKIAVLITGLFLLWILYYFIYAKRKYVTAAGYNSLTFPDETIAHIHGKNMPPTDGNDSTRDSSPPRGEEYQTTGELFAKTSIDKFSPKTEQTRHSSEQRDKKSKDWI